MTQAGGVVLVHENSNEARNLLRLGCYRNVIDFVRTHPNQYEPGLEDTFHRLIQKLDPPSTD